MTVITGDVASADLEAVGAYRNSAISATLALVSGRVLGTSESRNR